MKDSISEIIKRQNEVLSKPMATKKDIDYFNKVMSGNFKDKNISSHNTKGN